MHSAKTTPVHTYNTYAIDSYNQQPVTEANVEAKAMLDRSRTRRRRCTTLLQQLARMHEHLRFTYAAQKPIRYGKSITREAKYKTVLTNKERWNTDAQTISMYWSDNIKPAKLQSSAQA